jgi:DHA1 family multidrug resistance protein-like MFS transporter
LTPRSLVALYGCILVVMIGFGIALPVMPLYVERLAIESGASSARTTFHIGAITAAYPLAQLVFAPLWGRLSDRIGRRPLVAVGIAGFAVTQALFGLANGLALLYGARIVGGALSSALMPAASAYVADLTGETQRARGMAMLNTAVGVGTVIGPAIGALLVGRDVHFEIFKTHLVFDGFSVPFAAAALLAVVALGFALGTLRESRTPAKPITTAGSPRRVNRLFGAVLVSYVGISIFEATFALFAVARVAFGAREIAVAFTECGIVMILAQIITPPLARAIGAHRVIALGLGTMSAGLVALVAARSAPIVYAAVVLVGAGMALVGPTLTSELSKQHSGHVGAVLGVQQSVQGLGQVAGALVGVLLFGWSARVPYVATAALLAVVAVAMVVRRRES